tara:strand:- start:10011 stop:10634 length:624 start_codon:yes stop_codon:yes gene_type:complete
MNNILESRRLEKKLSLSKISKLSNISYSTTYRIFNNMIEKPKLKELKKLTDILDINYQQLIHAYGYLDKREDSLFYQIPIINWNSLKHYIPFGKSEPKILNKKESILSEEKNCFATEIPTNMYSPKLFKNDIVLCSTLKKIMHNDLILTFNKKTTSIEIAKYKNIKNNYFIHSLNPCSDQQIVEEKFAQNIVAYKIIKVSNSEIKSI